MTFKKISYEFYIINGIALLIYLFFIINSKGIYGTMYYTPDSKTYLAVANWLATGIDTTSLSIRPFLYPLILSIPTVLLGHYGHYGIWLIQIIFWFLTINFTFWTINKLTINKTYAYIGAFVVMTNLSLIRYTLHALTEVTTAFLLSVMIFYIVKNINKYKEIYFIHICLFFLVLLTIVKPVFFIPLVIIIIITPFFYFKKYKKTPLKLIKLFLILIPLIAQLTIIKVKYNKFNVSLIGSITFTNYLFAQGIQTINKIDRNKSIKKANSFSKGEQLKYLNANKTIYLNLFLSNIQDNIKVYPRYRPNGIINIYFSAYMSKVNEYYYKLHFIFIIFFIVLFYLFLRYKQYENLLILIILSGLSTYYIIVTGISFNEGDRLVLPSISIWTVLYSFVVFNLINRFRPKK